MAIKIGHASIDERGKASGGTAGDQTGGEVCIRSWYNANWDVILRPKSAEIAEKSAKACEAACANKHIGYDQNSRNTLYRYAKLVNFDLSKITDDCECDCSSLMHVCAIVGGANLGYGVNGLVTWNMVDAFVKSGDYEKLTDSKYLLSGDYLKRGDILVRTSGHTAMALENGSLIGRDDAGAPNNTANPSVGRDALIAPQTVTMLTPLPLLKRGAEGGAVWAMQTLLTDRGYCTVGVDSEFGANTESALKRFQKDMGLVADGECGCLTWEKLINGG
ncbi:MAG: peptidoglycan-binding protein [Ruminococcaceae bacterium]|nr:peptidoglycan-binding protein [Oscillospiraceae bacterium]